MIPYCVPAKDAVYQTEELRKYAAGMYEFISVWMLYFIIFWLSSYPIMPYH